MGSNAQDVHQQVNGGLQSAGHPGDPALEVYREALLSLVKAKVPFLVGGAFALESYTGLVRRTKDLDLFVNPADRLRLMQRLSDCGFDTEWRFPESAEVATVEFDSRHHRDVAEVENDLRFQI